MSDRRQEGLHDACADLPGAPLTYAAIQAYAEECAAAGCHALARALRRIRLASPEELLALMVEHWPEHAMNADGPPHERFDMHSILRLCGCGKPHETAAFVASTMRKINGRAWAPETHSDWFLAYELAARGWTDHGSSVPGWLTEKGKAALAVLDYFVSVDYLYE